jgi:hypothetical protein
MTAPISSIYDRFIKRIPIQEDVDLPLRLSDIDTLASETEKKGREREREEISSSDRTEIRTDDLDHDHHHHDHAGLENGGDNHRQSEVMGTGQTTSLQHHGSGTSNKDVDNTAGQKDKGWTGKRPKPDDKAGMKRYLHEQSIRHKRANNADKAKARFVRHHPFCSKLTVQMDSRIEMHRGPFWKQYKPGRCEGCDHTATAFAPFKDGVSMSTGEGKFDV